MQADHSAPVSVLRVVAVDFPAQVRGAGLRAGTVVRAGLLEV